MQNIQLLLFCWRLLSIIILRPFYINLINNHKDMILPYFPNILHYLSKLNRLLSFKCEYLIMFDLKDPKISNCLFGIYWLFFCWDKIYFFLQESCMVNKNSYLFLMCLHKTYHLSKFILSSLNFFGNDKANKAIIWLKNTNPGNLH